MLISQNLPAITQYFYKLMLWRQSNGATIQVEVFDIIQEFRYQKLNNTMNITIIRCQRKLQY